MRISVVILCHNLAAYVDLAVASVLGQTLAADEILLVGTDRRHDTEVALNRWRGRDTVEVFFSTEILRPGPSKALGVTRTTGEYVMVLDADDYLHRGYLRATAAELSRGADVCGSDYFCVGEDWTAPAALAEPDNVWPSNNLPSCSLFRRDAYELAGGFRDEPYDDWSLWVRMWLSGKKMHRVRSPMMYYFRHDNTYSNSLDHNEARRQIHDLMLSGHPIANDEVSIDNMWTDDRSDAEELDIRDEGKYLRAVPRKWATPEKIRPSSTRILIGAFSGRSMRARRELCRSTWIAEANARDDLMAFFLMGGDDKTVGQQSGASPPADMVLLPVPDTYASLPQRTRAFCEWALLRNDWDVLFKCDDDTSVAIDRLSRAGSHFYESDLDYQGQAISCAGEDPTCVYASGGAGYFLSRKAASLIAQHLTLQSGYEDFAVGRLLAEHGLRVTDDQRFQGFGGADISCVPNALNSRITAHAVPSELALKSHREVCEALFDIVMPVSNDYVYIAGQSLRLLSKWWPHHPPVNVLYYDYRVPIQGVNQITVGAQIRTPWTAGLKRYLETVNSNAILLLMLDDYALFKMVNRTGIARAAQMVMRNDQIDCVHLTWQPLQHAAHDYDKSGYLAMPTWDYSVNTQAAIWRASSLSKALASIPDGTAAHFELAASKEWNQTRYPEGFRMLTPPFPHPRNPSGMVDSTEKDAWLFPYHNLMNRGSLDRRHQRFCFEQGFQLIDSPIIATRQELPRAT